MGVFLAAALWAGAGREGEAIVVEGESLALEGTEGARGELVFWVVGGRVVVVVGLGVWPGVLDAAVWMCVRQSG